ncbi:MAG: hypothetical protein QW594_02845 [Candidatus Woesearchaeota archaeon]
MENTPKSSLEAKIHDGYPTGINTSATHGSIQELEQKATIADFFEFLKHQYAPESFSEDSINPRKGKNKTKNNKIMKQLLLGKTLSFFSPDCSYQITKPAKSSKVARWYEKIAHALTSFVSSITYSTKNKWDKKEANRSYAIAEILEKNKINPYALQLLQEHLEISFYAQKVHRTLAEALANKNLDSYDKVADILVQTTLFSLDTENNSIEKTTKENTSPYANLKANPQTLGKFIFSDAQQQTMEWYLQQLQSFNQNTQEKGTPEHEQAPTFQEKQDTKPDYNTLAATFLQTIDKQITHSIYYIDNSIGEYLYHLLDRKAPDNDPVLEKRLFQLRNAQTHEYITKQQELLGLRTALWSTQEQAQSDVQSYRELAMQYLAGTLQRHIPKTQELEPVQEKDKDETTPKTIATTKQEEREPTQEYQPLAPQGKGTIMTTTGIDKENKENQNTDTQNLESIIRNTQEKQNQESMTLQEKLSFQEKQEKGSSNLPATVEKEAPQATQTLDDKLTKEHYPTTQSEENQEPSTQNTPQTRKTPFIYSYFGKIMAWVGITLSAITVSYLTATKVFAPYESMVQKKQPNKQYTAPFQQEEQTPTKKREGEKTTTDNQEHRIQYTVQKGDNLTKIVSKFAENKLSNPALYHLVDAIGEDNKKAPQRAYYKSMKPTAENPNYLLPGQVLWIDKEKISKALAQQTKQEKTKKDNDQYESTLKKVLPSTSPLQKNDKEEDSNVSDQTPKEVPLVAAIVPTISSQTYSIETVIEKEIGPSYKRLLSVNDLQPSIRQQQDAQYDARRSMPAMSYTTYCKTHQPAIEKIINYYLNNTNATALALINNDESISKAFTSNGIMTTAKLYRLLDTYSKEQGIDKIRKSTMHQQKKAALLQAYVQT